MATSTIEELFFLTGRIAKLNKHRIDKVLNSISENQIVQYIELIKFHRVIPQVYSNMQSINYESSSNKSKINKIIKSIQSTHFYETQNTNDHEKELEYLARKTDLPFIGLKGFDVSRFYNEQTGVRTVRDIDVYVPEDKLLEFISFLIDEDYEVGKIRYGRYKLFRNNVNFPYYYGISPTTKNKSHNNLDVDIHFGAFPGIGESLVTINKDDFDLKYDGSTQRWFLKTEMSIIICLAHIIRNGFCRLRDINDLYLMLSDSNLDQVKLRNKIEDAHLNKIFNSVLKIMKACYNDVNFPIPGLEPRKSWSWKDKMLILEPKTVNKKFHDGVNFTWSRYWQLSYLFDMYSDYLGKIQSTKETLNGWRYLRKSGRPHGIWEGRKITDIKETERFVLTPIIQLKDVNMETLKEKTLNDDKFELVNPYGFIIYNKGHNEEIIITSEFVLTQCSYDGELSDIPDLSPDLEFILNKLEIQNYKMLLDFNSSRERLSQEGAV